MHSHLKSFLKKYPNWQAINLNKYSQTLNNPISFHYSFLVSPEPALSAVNYISADLNFVPFAAEWDALAAIHLYSFREDLVGVGQ